MSGSVPDLWGMLVVHCARALHKNLVDLHFLARERFSATNEVINKISRKVEDTLDEGRTNCTVTSIRSLRTR